jgi:hypothetical protein
MCGTHIHICACVRARARARVCICVFVHVYTLNTHTHTHTHTHIYIYIYIYIYARQLLCLLHIATGRNVQQEGSELDEKKNRKGKAAWREKFFFKLQGEKNSKGETWKENFLSKAKTFLICHVA